MVRAGFPGAKVIFGLGFSVLLGILFGVQETAQEFMVAWAWAMLLWCVWWAYWAGARWLWRQGR